MNESRSSVNYVESTSSSPRSDRRDMDSVDRRRYRGYAALCEKSLYCSFCNRVAAGQEMVKERNSSRS